jgi:hypothetical protein
VLSEQEGRLAEAFRKLADGLKAEASGLARDRIWEWLKDLGYSPTDQGG